MFTNQTASGFDFTGVLNVTNGENTSLSLSLSLGCSSGETCDYTNTGTFNWVLRSDVKVTPDSGVFLSQVGGTSVPEPASFVLIGAGLALAASRGEPILATETISRQPT